ncbi:MAG: adenylyl-sulfate kinase [Verrucomicrobia bacterium]|nr:adenylyl-sulfate kinase [Verrucomicrobiota bacterium]
MPGFSERILWISGLPGSGKTAAAAALRDYLQVEGWTTLVLDDAKRGRRCEDAG